MSIRQSRQPEPAPAPSPPPTGTVEVRKYNVKRSCIRCHERKVRCDKTTPCVACGRAEVLCQYPGPERAKRRSQNRASRSTAPTDPETRDSLASTRAAKEGSHRTSPPNGTAGSGHPGNTRYAPSESEQSGGFLLKEGGSTRYVNEFTFSRVLEKVRDFLLLWTIMWY